jgi:AcrR family transcriptional regulator
VRQEIAAYKRERILQEALHLFYENGFSKTTLDDVAAALGTTKQVIYSQFDSKGDVLVALCLPTIELAVSAAEKAAKEGSSAKDKLTHIIADFVKIVVTRQENIAVFYREAKNLPPDALNRIQALRQKFQSILIAMVEEGTKSGEFHVADPRVAALALYGMTSWTYIWHRSHGAIEPGPLSSMMVELALRVVGATTH